MVSDNEACHKHTAVIEFLTADQEPMENIHRGAIVGRSTAECPVKSCESSQGNNCLHYEPSSGHP